MRCKYFNGILYTEILFFLSGMVAWLSDNDSFAITGFLGTMSVLHSRSVSGYIRLRNENMQTGKMRFPGNLQPAFRPSEMNKLNGEERFHHPFRSLSVFPAVYISLEG